MIFNRKVLSDSKDNSNGIIKKVFTCNLSSSEFIYGRYYQYDIESLLFDGEYSNQHTTECSRENVQFTSRGYFLLLSNESTSVTFPNELNLENLSRECKESIKNVIQTDNENTHLVEIRKILESNLYKGHIITKSTFKSEYKICRLPKEIIYIKDDNCLSKREVSLLLLLCCSKE